MKRIVVLIDGTWNKEGDGADTNVAKLDIVEKLAAQAFVKPTASDGTVQSVHYHDGVGTDGGLVEHILGGAVGLGLKKIIKDVYTVVVANYVPGDEIYILGFSRGAYAARALAGLIGASGIQRQLDDTVFEIAWEHYRVAPATRMQPAAANASEQKAITSYNSLAATQAFHDIRSIKCVGVWDTVGSYGIPAGFGLAPLARYYTLLTLGFHDTSFGDHIEVGLHAVGVDEHRRPFVPTLWTIAKGMQPKGHVEQTWFGGAHCNVGGGYTDSGLSDLALIWMIGRIKAITPLEFDVQAIRASTKPNVGGIVVDSTVGWPLDHQFPHYRKILSPDATHHGYFGNTDDADQENINERVHWSVIEKRSARGTGSATEGAPYNPSNLPTLISAAKIAPVTEEEADLLQGLSNVPTA
jgi:uncharacterized protein (DUF2235 family)